MFLGTFEHSLDPKNRLSLPSKLRDKLAKNVVLSKGLDGCLELRTPEEFARYAAGLNTLSATKRDARMFLRQVFANAADVAIDSANRILIPAQLMQEGGLKRDVTIIGVGQKIEIWDQAAYAAFKAEADPQFEAVAEHLNATSNDE